MPIIIFAPILRFNRVPNFGRQIRAYTAKKIDNIRHFPDKFSKLIIIKLY